MRHFIFLRHLLKLLLLFFFFDFLISALLIKGLNKYYGFIDHPDILLNGSSMTMSGFNRKDIESCTKMKIATYAIEGVSVNDRFAMISHFFQKYPEGVKTVIYEINPILFSKIKSSENAFTIFYPYMDNNNIDKYLREKTSIKEYYTNKIIRTKRFDSRLIRLIIMGYLSNYNNLKTNKLDTTVLIPLIAQKGMADIIMERSSIEIFEDTMDLIRAHNSRIILVLMPMYYIKLQTFNKNGYINLCNYIEDYCSTQKDIKFLNMNKDSLIYNAGYFSDPLHFNFNGQRQLTKVICSNLVKE